MLLPRGTPVLFACIRSSNPGVIKQPGSRFIYGIAPEERARLRKQFTRFPEPFSLGTQPYRPNKSVTCFREQPSAARCCSAGGSHSSCSARFLTRCSSVTPRSPDHALGSSRALRSSCCLTSKRCPGVEPVGGAGGVLRNSLLKGN